MTAYEYPPGARAPSDGTYEQCDVLGSPTGVSVTLPQNALLPPAPRGFTWRIVDGGVDD